MADETKRVIDQTTDSSLAAGDFIIVDSQSEGTRKFDLGTELSDIRQDLAALEGGGVPTNVRQALKTLLESAAYANTGLTDEMAVVSSWASAVTAITLNHSSISISGATTSQLTATTTPSGGSVTWSSSDTSIATVSSSGLVTGVNNGTATIRVTSGDVYATCTVSVSGFAVLESISAVYTQSGIVYDTDSIDDLKNNLVVTATYDDTSTETLSSTDYRLSGTLTAGTSTITVSYGGKTTTFTVNVTHNDGALYRWDLTSSLTDEVDGKTATTTATQGSTGLVFDAASQYCDFGAIYQSGRTYEVDVAELGTGKSNRRRLFMADIDSDTAYGGGSGLICDNGTWKLYSGSAWLTISNSSFNGASYLNGKTLRVYVDSNMIWHMYAKTTGSSDSFTLIGEAPSAMKTYTNGHVYFGGSRDDGLANATITGLRVYEGELS